MEGTSDDNWDVYQNDSRTACKYGEKCYQKNPKHHSRFKHPPKRKITDGDQDEEINSAKRPRDDPDLQAADNSSHCSSSVDDNFVVPTSVMLEDTSNNSTADDKKDTIGNDDDIELPGPPLQDVPQDYEVKDSPADVRLNIEQKFLLEMPDDFFDLWDCCAQLNKEKPEEALSKAGLTLVGPYDVLTGKLNALKTRRVSSYVCHWRYYCDPPEFMTVIAGDEKEYHIGYFRDDPFLLPCFVASMSSVRPGAVIPIGENIFAGVCSYLTYKIKEENPFKKAPLQRLYKEVESYAKKKNYPLEAITPSMRTRSKRIVAKSFHGAGIVVPVENDVGYRNIPETNANLRKIFHRVVAAKNEEERKKYFDDIQELITNVQFAYDEGDFGMGIELGIDLFIFGGEVFHKAIFHLLGVGYELLGREPYIDIIQAHLKNRRRGSNLSILDVVE